MKASKTLVLVVSFAAATWGAPVAWAQTSRDPVRPPSAAPGRAAQAQESVASSLDRAKALIAEGRLAEAETLLARALAEIRQQRAAEARAAEARPAEGATVDFEALREGAVRVGGDVAPPEKIRDVKPVYPQAAIDQKISGVVILEAVIGRDGRVSGARVLRAARGLEDAALDAVTQWAYTPTLLNGVPTAVIMTVTVNFTLQ